MTLFDTTEALIEGFSFEFLRIEPHDSSDLEAGDTLWIIVHDCSEIQLSKGEFIHVSPLSEDMTTWIVSHDEAEITGGHFMHWDTSGTSSEVCSATLAYLNSLKDRSYFE